MPIPRTKESQVHTGKGMKIWRKQKTCWHLPASSDGSGQNSAGGVHGLENVLDITASGDLLDENHRHPLGSKGFMDAEEVDLRHLHRSRGYKKSSINQSINQSNDQSNHPLLRHRIIINQSIDRSKLTNQLINALLRQQINQSINQSTDRR